MTELYYKQRTTGLGRENADVIKNSQQYVLLLQAFAQDRQKKRINWKWHLNRTNRMEQITFFE